MEGSVEEGQQKAAEVDWLPPGHTRCEAPARVRLGGANVKLDRCSSAGVLSLQGLVLVSEDAHRLPEVVGRVLLLVRHVREQDEPQLV